MLLGFVFQVLKVRLIKMCNIEPPDLLFLVPFISFYISRYHFSQIFRTSFRNVLKKDFCHKFSFLTDSLNPITAKIRYFISKFWRSSKFWDTFPLIFLQSLKPWVNVPSLFIWFNTFLFTRLLLSSICPW